MNSIFFISKNSELTLRVVSDVDPNLIVSDNPDVVGVYQNMGYNARLLHLHHKKDDHWFAKNVNPPTSDFKEVPYLGFNLMESLSMDRFRFFYSLVQDDAVSFNINNANLYFSLDIDSIWIWLYYNKFKDDARSCTFLQTSSLRDWRTQMTLPLIRSLIQNNPVLVSYSHEQKMLEEVFDITSIYFFKDTRVKPPIPERILFNHSDLMVVILRKEQVNSAISLIKGLHHLFSSDVEGEYPILRALPLDDVAKEVLRKHAPEVPIGSLAQLEYAQKILDFVFDENMYYRYGGEFVLWERNKLYGDMLYNSTFALPDFVGEIHTL